MTTLYEGAFAKINLTLDVLDKREDGYHELEMVMCEIPLHDIVEMEKSDDISVSCNVSYIPCDERNIAFKAAKKFFEYTNIKSGVNKVSLPPIFVEKCF